MPLLHRHGPHWLGLLFVFLMPCALAQTAPVLQSDTAETREGYFVLSWTSANTGTLQLQQADNADFTEVRTREVPASGALTLTGFANGNYYFRAGRPEAWSNTLMVRVNHHALSRALGFFAAGLVLFLVLCAVILRGVSRTRREEAE